ncbi:MAG: hypothetical protein WKF47_12325 [Geodermatophilaceae bacterium]
MSKRARTQRARRTAEEDGVRVQDDGQAQKQRPDVLAKPEGNGDSQAENIMPDRGPHQDRNREQRSQQESVAHVLSHPGHRHAVMSTVAHGLLRRAGSPPSAE